MNGHQTFHQKYLDLCIDDIVVILNCIGNVLKNEIFTKTQPTRCVIYGLASKY